jgi:hypothetical protein
MYKHRINPAYTSHDNLASLVLFQWPRFDDHVGRYATDGKPFTYGLIGSITLCVVESSLDFYADLE